MTHLMIQFKLIIGIIWFAKFVLKYIYTQNLKVKKKKKKSIDRNKSKVLAMNKAGTPNLNSKFN